MKKIFRRAAAALVIAYALGLGIKTEGFLRSDGPTPFSVCASGESHVSEPPPNEAAAPVFSEADDETVILRETENGRIGVFLPGSPTPEYTLDVFVFTLPEEAASRLREGIECDAGTVSELIDYLTS